jgi:hypothetical protein
MIVGAWSIQLGQIKRRYEMGEGWLERTDDGDDDHGGVGLRVVGKNLVVSEWRANSRATAASASESGWWTAVDGAWSRSIFQLCSFATAFHLPRIWLDGCLACAVFIPCLMGSCSMRGLRLDRPK